MANYGSCSITEDKGPKNSKRCSSDLPFSIHLSLMVLGLWRPSRLRSVRWSKYENASLDDGENTKIHEDTTAETIFGGRPPKEEDVAMETDYIAEAEVWSPAKTESNKPDHHGLGITDFVFLTALVSLLVWYAVDMYYYIFASWGQGKFVLDTMSFFCYISQTFSIVAYALFTRLSVCLSICCRTKPLNVQALPFEMEFLGNRVALIQQNCDSTGRGRKGCLTTRQFLLFLSLPLVNTVAKIAFDIFVLPDRCQVVLQHFNNIVSALCFLCYGCFWYVVYVQRVSLHCQLNQALGKIRQLAVKGDSEGTRRLVDRIYSEFHIIRKFTGLWMAFTLFTVTILVICCAVLSYQDSITADVAAPVKSQEAWLSLMLWTQNAMFFVVPYRAIGGANLEYLWHRFRHVLTKCKVTDQLQFWREVETYVAQIDTLGTPALKFTLAFPFIGAMLSNALAQKNHISLEYWDYRYHCNEINENITSVLY